MSGVAGRRFSDPATDSRRMRERALGSRADSQDGTAGVSRHALDRLLATAARGLATAELVAHVAGGAAVTRRHERDAAGHDCEVGNHGLPCAERSVRFVTRNSRCAVGRGTARGAVAPRARIVAGVLTLFSPGVDVARRSPSVLVHGACVERVGNRQTPVTAFLPSRLAASSHDEAAIPRERFSLGVRATTHLETRGGEH